MIEAWFRIFAAKKKRRWYCFLLCEDFSKIPRRPNVLGRLGVFTGCLGVFTACFGIFTACLGVFTGCLGIFTACLGVFTGHIRKATSASLMRQLCGVFSAAHGGDVFKTSRSTRSLVVTFGWLRFQCPCRAVKSLCASPANKV